MLYINEFLIWVNVNKKKKKSIVYLAKGNCYFFAYIGY